MNRIITVVFISIIPYITLCGQIDNPYRKWEMHSVGEVILSKYSGFEDVELFIKTRLCLEDLCNKRILAKIKIDRLNSFEVVFYKYCPFEYPIITPKTKVIIDSCINNKLAIRRLLNNVIDSTLKDTDLQKKDFAVIWHRPFCYEELIDFFSIANSIYSKKFVQYGKEGIDYYKFPVMFFSLKDKSDWNIRDTIPLIRIKNKGDSIIILK